MILEYTVHNLGEYFEAISKIENYYNSILNTNDSNVMWFRGHEQSCWNLSPSIYRLYEKKPYTKLKSYTRSDMLNQELMRIQHYSAKNTHQMPFNPQNQFEWLEIMQHFGTKTRLLDWTESSIHALMVALEPMFDAKRCKTCSRNDFSPAVWTVAPQKNNLKIAEIFHNNPTLWDVLRNDFTPKPNNIDFKAQVKKDIVDHIQFIEDNTNFKQINGIYNLSEIMNDLHNRTTPKILFNSCRYYSLYYNLLLKYYLDGYNNDQKIADKLLPLCIVQPYHNERIKAQKGVFMIFPAYQEHHNCGIPVSQHDDLYTKINIERPDIIFKELSLNGIHRSWLYPEAEIVAGEVESV